MAGNTPLGLLASLGIQFDRYACARRWGIIASFSIFAGTSALAHGGHAHHQEAQPTAAPLKPSTNAKVEPSKSLPKQRTAALASINTQYQAQLKPIFMEKCGDCHSSQSRYPWYYQIPGVKQLIDRDIAEAREHIDLSHDFPFDGHGTPEDDIRAIRETIEERSMPPRSYRLLHRNAGLTSDEEKAVVAWTKESEVALSQAK